VVTLSLIPVYLHFSCSQHTDTSPALLIFCKYGPLSALIRTNRTTSFLFVAGCYIFWSGSPLGLFLSPYLQLAFYFPLLGLFDALTRPLSLTLLGPFSLVHFNQSYDLPGRATLPQSVGFTLEIRCEMRLSRYNITLASLSCISGP
jgi:hypothetical protein